MIIDPTANDLGPLPPHSGECSSTALIIDVDYDSISSKLPEDPPPYTELDRVESPPAVLDPGPGVPRTLSRTTADFRHSHVSCGVPSSGEQVQEGLIQIAKSVLFIAEAALITVGGLAQGIGKVLNGLGMAVAERRALFSWKGF